MDLMVSGIRPLEADELNEIIQQIERKHYTCITLGEFMDAREKCRRQDIWRLGASVIEKQIEAAAKSRPGIANRGRSKQ